MDNDEILKEMLINEDKKSHLFGIINNISPEILVELYKMGVEDSDNYNTNLEYSTNLKVRCFSQVIEELYKKYC
jgi:hypothetical protein